MTTDRRATRLDSVRQTVIQKAGEEEDKCSEERREQRRRQEVASWQVTLRRKSRDPAPRLQQVQSAAFDALSPPTIPTSMMRQLLLPPRLRILPPRSARQLNSRLFARRYATQRSSRAPNDGIQWTNRKESIPVAPRRNTSPAQHARATATHSMANARWFIPMLN
jgi:hypothetical protein